MSPWITLQEYSYRKGVSISTLRRKIKNEEIEYKLQKGRYFLKAESKEQISKENEIQYILLQEKEKELAQLKNNYEDLISLVNFLEMEKRELLKQVKNKPILSV